MIDVKSFVAVSGVSGVSKLIAVRPNGLIIESFDTKDRRFVPVRSHEFSPFETISIYTDNDTVSLAHVFTNMKAQENEHPLPSEKADSATLRRYFTAVLPEHDRDRVHTSDIKKVIKWYNFLNSRDLLHEKTEETTATEETPTNTEG